ncbi:hypothetical protein [Qipengyuania huizhouensis]|uniref:hypothetical protein n=1 Tax=Qipengyuania huizhouensis TaxID=2867245 RepID=UPI001C8879F4|nr:hypothetical protein [Qipengyuania huizhouensis]MBX7459552.1 hypothetical protein [Qipengyuania huizhouensis]
MRAALVLLSSLALLSCSEPASEWMVNGDSAVVEADLGELPVINTMNRSKELLATAPRVKNLTIRYYGQTEDRLGNDERNLFYSAQFDGEEIARANFTNLDQFEAAALATSVTRGSQEGNRILYGQCPFTEQVCADALN